MMKAVDLGLKMSRESTKVVGGSSGGKQCK